MHQPSYDAFLELANKGNSVPVSRVIMADLETPVTAFMKLTRDDPHAFLLESVENGERLGRFSFLGCRPSRRFYCKNNQLTVTDGESSETFEVARGNDPLTHLEQFIKRFEPAPVEGLPPFYGGLVGFLGYEMIQYFEKFNLQNRDDYDIPDAAFFYADTVVAFDHFDRTIRVIHNAFIDGDPRAAYDAAVKKIDEIVERLREPLPPVSFGAGRETPPEVKTNVEPETFKQSVDRSKEYIRAGDICQVVVGMRSEVEVQSTPLDLYRALRRVNPSPYTFFFRCDDFCLVGGSPEILVKLTEDRVTYRPIAGTRRRGKTTEEDLFFEKELINDPKEQAEHIMLVDLGRNDIGRVCRFHSVEVTDLMYVERYSHVMHLVSNVEGDLLPDRDGFDLMRAVFPAGTVTGAPKIRAMQIIEELETTKRGPYSGALGYIGLSGDMDFCITLRTIVVTGGKAYVQAGAGIVADSDRDLEYKEVMNKSRAMLRAIELAECSKE
ncbi:MAG: anthranilate synthase component I [bacterium]|nr:anthranilate synthase component I [bacterium]